LRNADFGLERQVLKSAFRNREVSLKRMAFIIINGGEDELSMKVKKFVSVTVLAFIAAIAAACGQEAPTVTRTTPHHTQPATGQNTPVAQSRARVPAFQDAKSAKNLGPTLQPDQFFGPTREAYRVVKEIPETIAQLPCYCHCDQSIGHKSLYSCFQDTHASQCAVCVNEALIAYNLQKSGMTPAQIRERIIAQYSRQE
jgi:hypothetical protein